MGVLILTAIAEVVRDPTLTLADGYWIGPLPWTPLGVGLVISGATVVVVFGAASAWLQKGVIRRAVTMLASALAACWWFVALLPPPQGAHCPDCLAPVPDPLTYAYSLPEVALAGLILPAMLIGAMALTAAPQRPRGR